MSPLLRVWPVSARTPAALAAQADRLHQHLIDHPDLDLTDVAYSLATTRTQHPYRAAITAPADSEDPRQDLLDGLARTTRRPTPPRADPTPPSGPPAGKTVFVFPGQGAQYPGMGAQLYHHHRGFAAALDECDQALRPFTGWSVREVMLPGPGGAVAGPGRCGPAGVVRGDGVAGRGAGAATGSCRTAVIGHSKGEIAAAYIAGVLSLADAAKVGRAAQSSAGAACPVPGRWPRCC